MKNYLVYLMRLWPAGEKAGAWRACLENPHTGERHGFADVAALHAFLRDEMAAWHEAEAAGQEDGASVAEMEKELYELVGRALTDAAFRARLMEDPRRAAREEGYSLTADQVAGLKASDWQSMAERIDERLNKSAG